MSNKMRAGHIWKISVCLKRKVFNKFVLPPMTHGSKTFAVNTRMIQNCGFLEEARKDYDKNKREKEG